MSDLMNSEPFDRLTERQRDYLRHVHERRSSAEIAYLTGASARAVDKQLLLAKNLLGAGSRFQAAKLFADHEAGVESSSPATNRPSPPTLLPLPLPLPTAIEPTNRMTWQQVATWGVIIAIATPVALTVAAMVIVSISLLVGDRYG